MDPAHETAFRLFNGFTEGCPDIVIDVYGDTAVLHNHADPPEKGSALVDVAMQSLRGALPWLRAALLKTRSGDSMQERRGRLLFGELPTQKIIEHDVWYALDLTLNQDASFYLDTRNLRRWALDHLAGKTVLNAFAYTGSLGVAALAGGATRVVQLDRNRRFLDLAKTSYRLNRLPVEEGDFLRGDFFRETAEFRRNRDRFDCVFIDPPFFASSSTGVIDQGNAGARLINKVRPLVADGGYLVAINNALYVSGSTYMRTLSRLCEEEYLRIVGLIPVPDDFTGYPGTRVGGYVTDPAPFNHPTKIAVLGIRSEFNQAAREEGDAPGSGLR
jgi:23S rRNA (cytosine1962-C5)-methyltransferase